MRKETITKKLIELRAGRPQKQVANAVGISPSALSMYEKGERIPRDDIKEKLASYYGVRVEQIFYA